MEDVFLSIIIPIYNGENYLQRTIESILASGIGEFQTEILLIDDGSVDNTASICTQYVNDYPKLFRYFYKTNGGLSSARNYGIQQSSGRYLYFIDDDDLLRPGSLRLFFTKYYDDRYDVLGFSSDTINNTENLVIEKGKEGEVVFEGRGKTFINSVTPSFVWVYWYKRSFIINNGVEFTILYPEDCMFNLMVFRLDPLVIITSQKVICYMNYNDAGQLTKERNPVKLRKIVTGYMSYFEELYCSHFSHCVENKAIKMAVNKQIVPFVSRCLSSDITLSNFLSIKKDLKRMKLLDFNTRSKVSTKICRIIFNTSFLFPLYQFLFKNIFVRMILPKLDRSRNLFS